MYIMIVKIVCLLILGTSKNILLARNVYIYFYRNIQNYFTTKAEQPKQLFIVLQLQIHLSNCKLCDKQQNPLMHFFLKVNMMLRFLRIGCQRGKIHLAICDEEVWVRTFLVDTISCRDQTNVYFKLAMDFLKPCYRETLL